MNIAFLCCHLTGTGHLVRTLALARAARRLGHEATVISGGRPLPHVSADVPVIQLPPVLVRGFAFGDLREPGGEPVSACYMASRLRMLHDAIASLRPDALVFELYPFGRRVLDGEFRQAIAGARAARPGCVLAVSVRDIPEPKPARLAETAARLSADFDAVLVHGDAGFLPLSTTWPLPEELSSMIHHTGYVGAVEMPRVPRRDDVLVAVGGGVLGRRLLETAARAAARSSRPWRLLVGGADAAEVVALLSGGAPANLAVEPARQDYRALLAGAGCSVSLCGYNTAVELARCRTPALLVPSDEAGEQEQSIRAARLAGHEGFRLMRMDDLSPAALAEAAESLAARPRRPVVPLAGDDGAAAIARLAEITAAKSMA
jgi:UDP-N-acetylglucosamine--N-acetylmuramyl-(pentapeptide) pyrophosphoryl-undecaprenol N-acetylglucosamine transferase